MKITHLLTLVLGLTLLTSLQLNAQKSINRIYDYYEVHAYHLTIKKINELKPKLRSSADLQFMLADCYWNIGQQKKSAQVYKAVASEHAIPLAFQDKYETAVVSLTLDTNVDRTNTDVGIISNNSLTTDFNPGMLEEQQALHQEVAARKKSHNNSSTNGNSNNIAINNETASLTFSLDEGDHTTEKTQPSVLEVFRANDNKTAGTYRIRISIKTKNETEELKSLQGLKNVSSSKWEGKKIILAGYFDTVEEAADIIEGYLEEEYKNISVVTKKGNKYKSVDTALAAK
ncbi:MAG: hypothetical protein AB8F74_05660 [Saprospiraceae bacterium]